MNASSDLPSAPTPRWLPLVALALIVLVALVLRLWQMGESLWLDELHTSWVVIDGPGPIAQRAAMGNTSPAYFYLVWAVTQVLGHTEFSLRLLSLAAGVGLLPLLYFVVVKATGQPGAGLLAAAMAALDPNGLYYSIEARCYALVVLVSVVQVWLFWRLLAGGEEEAEGARRRRGWLRVGFIGTSLLLFYLHYTTGLLLAGEAVAYVLLCLRVERVFVWLRLGRATDDSGGPFWQVNYSPVAMAFDMVVILGGALVMLSRLTAVYERRGNWEVFIFPPRWQAMFQLFPLVIYLLTPLAALVAGWVIQSLGRNPQRGKKPVATSSQLVLLCVCWFFVPLFMCWYLSHYEIVAIFLRRYLMASAAALFVLAGLIYAEIPSRLARAGCWFAALAFLLGGDGVVTTGVIRQYTLDGRFVEHSNEDWRGAVAWLNERLEEDDTVLLQPGVIEQREFNFENGSQEEREYLSFPVRGIYRLEAKVWGDEGAAEIAHYGLQRGLGEERRYFTERVPVTEEMRQDLRLMFLPPELGPTWQFERILVYDSSITRYEWPGREAGDRPILLPD